MNPNHKLNFIQNQITYKSGYNKTNVKIKDVIDKQKPYRFFLKHNAKSERSRQLKTKVPNSKSKVNRKVIIHRAYSDRNHTQNISQKGRNIQKRTRIHEKQINFANKLRSYDTKQNKTNENPSALIRKRKHSAKLLQDWFSSNSAFDIL